MTVVRDSKKGTQMTQEEVVEEEEKVEETEEEENPIIEMEKAEDGRYYPVV